MKITFFIIFYTIMYIKRSSEKEIDSIMKNRRIRMTTFTRNIYMTSFLTNWELEDLLKSETTLHDSDLTMRIILFNINYMNNILCNLSKEKKVFYIRLKLQVISYDLSMIGELIVHCGFYAADDKFYENNNDVSDYVYLQIDIPQYSFFNLRLRTAFDSVDVTYKIEKIGQQQCNWEKDSSQNNENFIMPIKFRLGRNLKSVMGPRNIKQQLEHFRIDKPLQMYRNADSKKRKDFSKRPRFKKRKNIYYPSGTSRFSEQRRPSLLLRKIGNIEKQYFSSIKRSIRKRSNTNDTANVKLTKSDKLVEKTSTVKNNLHGSNGVETTSNLDDEKEATIYIDTLQLLSSFLTTAQDSVIDIDYKSYWTNVMQTLSGGVEEKSTLSTFDINEYESSTMDYNYYVDDSLKLDQDDKDKYEYDYEYEEPMEHSVRWYDYFEENVTFTTIPTQIDQNRLHIEATMSFVTRTNLIFTSGKTYFNVEEKTDSTIDVILLPLIETTKAVTLADDTSSLVAIKSENGRTFTRVQKTTIKSITELTITAITLQSYISEIDNETLEIITTQLIIPMTLESVSTKPSSSLIIKEMTPAAGNITEPLLSEETRVIFTHEIMETTTLTLLTFESSMIIDPSLIFTFSTTGYVTTMEFITETRRREISEREIIIDRTYIPTEIITEIRLSYFTSSTDASIFSSITIENETGGTSFEEEQSFTPISLEDRTILMKEERTTGATSEKTNTAFTIAPEITEVDESTSRIKIEQFLAFTTFITEITQTEEKTSAIASKTTYATAFTVTPEISQLEEDFSTKIQEIICTAVTVKTETIEVEESTSTITIDKFLTTFTTFITGITQTEEKTSVIASKTTYAATFTVTPEISQLEEDFSTKIQEIICTAVTVKTETIEVEESTSTITIDKFLTTFTTFITGITQTEEKTSVIASKTTYAATFTVTPEISQVEEGFSTKIQEIICTAVTVKTETIEVEESTSTITIDKFLTTFTTFITGITQTEEKTSAIASKTTYAASFTVTPEISQVEEDFSTKIQEIICTAVTVKSETIEVEESTRTVTIETFLTTFTIIPTRTLVEHGPKTSIIYGSMTVSPEVISIIDESSEIIKNQTMLSSNAVTINLMENIINVTKMEDTLMLIFTETSLTLPKASQPFDTSSVSSPPEIYKFTIVAGPSSTTINLGIDIASSSIFAETTLPASEIILISSISSYNDTYSHMIAFPETSDISGKETYLSTAASEILVTHNTDWTIFQILEETVPLSSTISTDIITVVEKISKPKSTTTLSTLLELSLSVESMSVTPLEEIDTPTLISSIYSTTKEEEIRILTETKVRNETIHQLFTFTSFYTGVTTISMSEELGLSSSIFVYPVTFIKIEEGTRMLRKTTTSEIVPQLFTSIFFTFETITSLTPKITIFFSGTITPKLTTVYSNVTTIYWPKETHLLTTTLSTAFPILLTSPLQNISFTFFSEISIEYLSTFAPLLPTDVIISMPFEVTVLTEEMHQYLTRSTTPIDRHTTVVPPRSSKAMPTENTIMETEIEEYEEPEKFYDVEYGEDFREAYEDEEYTDMDESITKWYDYEEEDEEVVTLDRKTTSKSKTPKIVDKESVSTELPFATKSTITDTTIMTFLSEKSAEATIMTTIMTFLSEKLTETSSEIETTPTTTEIFITLISPTETSKITYETSDISLVETYRTSYETEKTTMISEYEISSSIFKTVEDFETLSTEITPISLFCTIEEYTLTTGKILIYTTEQLEWWIKQSSFETRDYILTKFELSDQKTILDITLPKFLTSPGERSTTEQYKELGLTTSELFYEFTNETESTVYSKKISSTLLLFSTDLLVQTWIVEEKTSKLDVILETERFFDGMITDESTNFERMVTTAEYIERKIEEGTSLTIPRGESSTFVVGTETMELKLYSTTFFDLVPSPVSDILNKETNGETDQEEKLKNLMDEIKRMENREKEIAEKEEEQKIMEEELEKRKRTKEMGERERKGTTNITDTTGSFFSSLTSYNEKTMSESIKLLSIDDTVTTYTFITLESTSAITIEPTIPDPFVKSQDLRQEIERLKKELNRKEDKLKKWERQLQERKARFEKEKKEFEENVQSEFWEKMGQEITMLPDITDESAFFSFFSTDAIDVNTTHKLYVSSTISPAQTFSSSTFKPPVESELFTPAPPTEKITSTLRHLNRVKIAREKCKEGKNKDLVERGEENLQQSK